MRQQPAPPTTTAAAAAVVGAASSSNASPPPVTSNTADALETDANQSIVSNLTDDATPSMVGRVRAGISNITGQAWAIMTAAGVDSSSSEEDGDDDGNNNNNERQGEG
jgi:hypothetical protein